MSRPASIFYPPQMPLVRSMGRFKFRLAEDYPISIVFEDGTSKSYAAKEGFVCDLYSSPLIFQAIVPKSQRSDIPALIHDLSFATGGFRETADDDPFLPLADCNLLLSIGMKQEDFTPLEHALIYRPVQLGSGKPWRRCLARGASLATPIME